MVEQVIVHSLMRRVMTNHKLFTHLVDVITAGFLRINASTEMITSSYSRSVRPSGESCVSQSCTAAFAAFVPLISDDRHTAPPLSVEIPTGFSASLAKKPTPPRCSTLTRVCPGTAILDMPWRYHTSHIILPSGVLIGRTMALNIRTEF